MTKKASAPNNLPKLREAAKMASLAQDNLHWHIREGRAEGISLRELASAAGLSHETVRRICESE